MTRHIITSEELAGLQQTEFNQQIVASTADDKTIWLSVLNDDIVYTVRQRGELMAMCYKLATAVVRYNEL